MVPVIWLALTGANYLRIAPIFALIRIFFPVNEKATLKTKQPIRFQGLFTVTNQIAGKWKTKSNMWQLLFPKVLLFPPKKWMNLISDQLSIASIKYLNWPSPVFGRFQPRVVQFWSEIILVISHRTRTACPFDFEITRMISAQIALYSVQLPLLINDWSTIRYKPSKIILLDYCTFRSFSSHIIISQMLVKILSCCNGNQYTTSVVSHAW